MKTGIIGLPQVGKTSLFRILTKAKLDAHAMHSRDAHVGIARVPDERLVKCNAQLEGGQSLRELDFNADERKRLRGFAFLSQKPILYVVNIGESADLGKDLDAAAARYGLAETASRPNAGVTAICGKVEAELAE